jgi:hypothetical protein
MLASPALVALLLLAGCVSIPTSGDVQTQEIDADSDEPQNVTLPEGPVDGQSMTELLAGFLRAGRGPQDNYSVAQQFLAPNTDWNGTSRVLVTSSAITPIQLDSDTVGVTVTVVGEVDATGHYTEVPAQSQTLSYDFVQIDGQYRISRADPGTVLRESAFASAFDSYPLYYFDPSFDYLVPDLRWFPVIRNVANRIVRELAAGPSAPLQAGVVISAFPQGVSAEAVTDAPRVDVELGAEVRSESALTQRRIIQQIDASLDALSNITDLAVSAGGLDLAPAGGTAPVSVYTVRDNVIGGLGGAFGTLTADGVNPLDAIGTTADALAPTAASLARDRGAVAVLGPDGVSLVDGSRVVAIDSRADLAAPSLDLHGVVWTVPRTAPGGLLVTAPGEDPQALPLPVDGEVVALEISRDGARALLALATANGPRVTVLGILRDADLVPVAFGPAYDLEVSGSVVDVAWVDGSHVAVLSADADGTQVDVLALGGPRQSLGDIDGGVQLVGGNQVAGIRVLLANGSVERPSDAGGWRDTGLTASFLGTQQ